VAAAFFASLAAQVQNLSRAEGWHKDWGMAFYFGSGSVMHKRRMRADSLIFHMDAVAGWVNRVMPLCSTEALSGKQ
jgi:hypothetical protein